MSKAVESVGAVGIDKLLRLHASRSPAVAKSRERLPL